MPSCRGKNLELLDSDRTKRPSCQYRGLLLRKSQTQAVYAQHTAQKPGLGFPIARVVALLHLGTGCLLDAAIGPYQGKDTSEIAMLRHLLACFSALNPDELVRQILRCISQCRVGNRPGRFEPRCVKRRRDQYKLMMKPRDKLRQRLGKGDNSFE